MRAKRATVVGAIALAVAVTAAGCTTRNDDDGGGSGGGEDDQITVAFVPKLQGIPYFEAMNAGGEAAADELGIKWLYQGPTTADAAAQADIVRSFIQQDVDALIVAPNDPDSMAPLLKEAADQGIKVATSDTDAPNSVREVFVNQASVEGIGQALTDSLMTAMGGAGKYAIVSCGETAANLNAWIAVQEEYTASEYPDAEIVDIVYAGEDQAAATSMATDLMNANPDLTGLVGELLPRPGGEVAQVLHVPENRGAG
jgi:rhamnose transport system substrate-binding protein